MEVVVEFDAGGVVGEPALAADVDVETFRGAAAFVAVAGIVAALVLFDALAAAVPLPCASILPRPSAGVAVCEHQRRSQSLASAELARA